jgi:hypothetical protein
MGAGAPLAPELRAFFEPRLGVDLAAARVHAEEEGADLAAAVGARAFSYGSDLVFARGEWAPSTDRGREVLAHELVHVAQQARSAGGRGDVLSRAMNPLCQQTARFAGNIEHEVIELDYRTQVNPVSATEFSIPGGGDKGGVGFADIVDLRDHSIYEIKTFLGQADGAVQAARYMAFALLNCDPSAPWHLGTAYPRRTVQLNRTTELVVQQSKLPGVIYYYPRNRRPPPVRVRAPDPKTITVLLAILAAIAAAKKAGGKRLPGRVPAFAYAGLAATLILLVSGRARASVAGEGTDSDPVETLIKSLSMSGVEVPPELQKMIQDDPELKAAVEKSAKGNPSEAELELTRKMIQVLTENPGDFDEDDLKILLKIQEEIPGEGAAAEVTAQKLRTLIEEKKAGITRPAGSEKGPASPQEAQANAAEQRRRDAEAAAEAAARVVAPPAPAAVVPARTPAAAPSPRGTPAHRAARSRRICQRSRRKSAPSWRRLRSTCDSCFS